MTEAIEQPYAGGLNYVAEDLATKEGTVPDAANVTFGMGGRVATRGGSTRSSVVTLSVSPTVRDMYVVEETDRGAASQLIVTGGSVTRVTSPATGGTPVASWQGSYARTSVAGAVTQLRAQGVAFVDTSAATPAYGTVITFGGNSSPVAYVRNPDNAVSQSHADWGFNGYPTTCAAYAGRMWYAGVPGFPARLYYSRVATFGNFTPSTTAVSSDGGTIDMQLVDGGSIIALKHLYDMLIVFTTRGVYRLVTLTTGLVPFKATQLSTHVAVSQHAVVQADNEIYLMTEAGVYKMSTALTYGDIQSDEITTAITPVFENASMWELSGAFGVFDKSERKVHFFFQTNYAPAGGTAGVLPNEFTLAQAQARIDAGEQFYPPSVSTCYTYDIRGKAWERHYFPFYIDYAVAHNRGDGTTVVEAYTRKADNGTVDNLAVLESEVFDRAVSVDNGAAIPAYLRTRKWPLDGIGYRKTRLFLFSYIKSGNPAAAVSFDDAPFTQISPALPTGVSRVAAVGSGNVAQVEYSGAAPWELNAVSPDIKKLGRR